MDLSRERKLLEEARAAVKIVDLATARAKAGEAIAALLAQSRSSGEGEESWLKLLDAAGRVAVDAQDVRAARTAWERVFEVRSRTLTDDQPELQRLKQDLAATMYSLGDLQGARELLEKVVEVSSRTLPDDHPDLQKARLNLAVAMYTLGDLAGARALGEKVLEVFSRTLPDDHPNLQTARQNLAVTIKALGDLKSARALEEKVLEVFSRTLPDDHPDLQAARGNLANTMYTLGDLADAHSLFEKVLEARLRTLPDDHPDLQEARENLAFTIEALGDLAGARTLQQKVLETSLRSLPDDHPDLQAARENLAITIAALGDLQGARALEEKILEVRSRSLPDDHPNLQAARGNLAVTIHNLGDLQGARALEQKVLEVRSRTLPDDHPDLQTARLNLATTIEALGDRQGARALEEKVLQVRSRTLPDDHPDLQRVRLNLAATIKALGDLAGARALEEKVLEGFSRTLPEDHPDLQWARASLALTIAAGRVVGRKSEGGGKEESRRQEQGEKEEFTRLADLFTRAIARSARWAVLTASSREAEERCVHSLPDLGCALSFAEGLGVFEKDAGLEREAFTLSEETRGAALASAHLSRRAIADQRYGRLREETRSASDDLARLARNGADADELDVARTRREKAEREVIDLARELSGNEAGLLDLDLGALSQSLSEREALVGYRRYTRVAHEPGGGLEPKSSESLCAFVLRSADRLERIELGPIEPIEGAVSRLRQAIGVGAGRGVGVTPGPSTSADGVPAAGVAVRRMIFDPLLPALDGTERVVVALDDVLHLVPLDALPLETTPAGYLGDRWRIETRCSLPELLWKETPLPHGGTLLPLGGAGFDAAPLPLSADETPADGVEGTAPDAARSGSAQVASVLRGGTWERGFEPLVHAGPEARGIAALYGEAFDGKRFSIVLEDRKASRASLAELAPKARFLHIATHGWFAPESMRSIADPQPLDVKMGFGARMSGEERAKGMSPMLLCGLALAGANLKEDELGRAPGLVTAEELSTFDLSGCELAVLSACDTNVGERRAGQGVASLQKALHMAGARSVITSLWKVPDEATRELMLDFYRRVWVEKKPKARALWEAKMKIRNAKDERGHPLYTTRDWAAWVLTGDPD